MILEFSRPANPLFRAVYEFLLHRILPRIGGHGLARPQSLRIFSPLRSGGVPAPARFLRRLEAAGFKNCRPGAKAAELPKFIPRTMMKMKVQKWLPAPMILAVALSAGFLSRAVEKAADKVRFSGVEKVERQGLTGAEVVVRIDNGSGYNLPSSAEIGIYYGNSRVGTVVLRDP